MINYNKKITLTLILFLIIAYFSHFVLERGITYYNKSSYDKFNEMFSNKKSYDVLLLGSSRTHRNIDVRICDSICQKSFYNGGISGAGGHEMFTCLKGFLQSHPKPKYVVLNIDIGILNIDRIFFDPNFYFKNLDNEAIYNSLYKKDFPVFLYKYFPFFRIIEFSDDMRIDAIKGLLGKQKSSIAHYNGYLVPFEKGKSLDTIVEKTNVRYNEANFQYLDSIVATCQRNNIKICFINSPSYYQWYSRISINYSGALKIIENNYCLKSSIKMLNFDTLRMNNNYSFFMDIIHLNKKGTEEFSMILAKTLKENCFVLMDKKDN